LPLLRDAAWFVAVATVLALGVNALRSSGSIPLVQRTPYEIVVPCPEPVGDAQATAADDPRLTQATSLVIDARSRAEFDAFHVPGAINVPFDWLGPPVEAETAEVAKRVAHSHAHSVIVYGDGDDPDSGREWARLLAGGGIKNVFHVQGGAPAIRAKLATPPANSSRGDKP
jgi:3-mercaptopyruvate sulfurtransferase SseA